MVGWIIAAFEVVFVWFAERTKMLRATTTIPTKELRMAIYFRDTYFFLLCVWCGIGLALDKSTICCVSIHSLYSIRLTNDHGLRTIMIEEDYVCLLQKDQSKEEYGHFKRL